MGNDAVTVDDQTVNEETFLRGFNAAMGVRLIKASGDEVIIEYEVGERHLQPYGIVHGGMHCAAIETACSMGAGLVALARGQAIVGVENHTTFLRAVRSGVIRITALPLTRGRQSHVWDATARTADGKVVSTGRVRLLCIDPKADLAGEPVIMR